jgi:hypothetical protein
MTRLGRVIRRILVHFFNRCASSQLLGVAEELYREGMIVKALDASGEPLLRKGHQVYKHVDYATSAERAFWNNENKVS